MITDSKIMFEPTYSAENCRQQVSNIVFSHYSDKEISKVFISHSKLIFYIANVISYDI